MSSGFQCLSSCLMNVDIRQYFVLYKYRVSAIFTGLLLVAAKLELQLFPGQPTFQPLSPPKSSNTVHGGDNP